ncbi:MAG: hypothetical protein GXP58_11510 [Deltaproteobacteria bacterium]|nr:hypothetical protein [Deltaproteobacteria bacterium]
MILIGILLLIGSTDMDFTPIRAGVKSPVDGQKRIDHGEHGESRGKPKAYLAKDAKVRGVKSKSRAKADIS